MFACKENSIEGILVTQWTRQSSIYFRAFYIQGLTSITNFTDLITCVAFFYCILRWKTLAWVSPTEKNTTWVNL